MNRRRHVPHLFSAYIDGDLSPARTRAVETHLAACPACARELEQWRAVLRLVSYHAAVTCPIDCAEAVLQRIAAQPSSFSLLPHPSALGRPLIPALALILMLLGSGTWFWAIHGAGRAVPGISVGAPLVGARRDDHPARGHPRGVPLQTVAEGAGKARPATIAPAASEPAPGIQMRDENPRLTAGAAVRVHAPDRLQEAFGRSDSLILAADFAEDDR